MGGHPKGVDGFRKGSIAYKLSTMEVDEQIFRFYSYFFILNTYLNIIKK